LTFLSFSFLLSEKVSSILSSFSLHLNFTRNKVIHIKREEQKCKA
jgi:hypothetical protein